MAEMTKFDWAMAIRNLRVMEHDESRAAVKAVHDKYLNLYSYAEQCYADAPEHGSGENSKGTPPHENSNNTPPSNEN